MKKLSQVEFDRLVNKVIDREERRLQQEAYKYLVTDTKAILTHNYAYERITEALAEKMNDYIRARVRVWYRGNDELACAIPPKDITWEIKVEQGPHAPVVVGNIIPKLLHLMRDGKAPVKFFNPSHLELKSLVHTEQLAEEIAHSQPPKPEPGSEVPDPTQVDEVAKWMTSPTSDKAHDSADPEAREREYLEALDKAVQERDAELRRLDLEVRKVWDRFCAVVASNGKPSQSRPIEPSKRDNYYPLLQETDPGCVASLIEEKLKWCKVARIFAHSSIDKTALGTPLANLLGSVIRTYEGHIPNAKLLEVVSAGISYLKQLDWAVDLDTDDQRRWFTHTPGQPRGGFTLSEK